MEYIVNGSQAREIDRCSIQEIGIPSMVLMEKAAMSVASCIMAQADKKQDRILVVCGTGNNGGDGVAAAAYAAGCRLYCQCTCFGTGRTLLRRDETADLHCKTSWCVRLLGQPYWGN